MARGSVCSYSEKEFAGDKKIFPLFKLPCHGHNLLTTGKVQKNRSFKMKAKSAAALFFALLLEKTEIKALGYNFKWLNSQYYYNLLHFLQP